MRISDWSSDVCSSDLTARRSGGYFRHRDGQPRTARSPGCRAAVIPERFPRRLAFQAPGQWPIEDIISSSKGKKEDVYTWFCGAFTGTSKKSVRTTCPVSRGQLKLSCDNRLDRTSTRLNFRH